MLRHFDAVLSIEQVLHHSNPTQHNSKMCKQGQRTDNMQSLMNKDKNSLTEFTTVNVHQATLTHAIVITITVVVFCLLLVFSLKYWYSSCTMERNTTVSGGYIRRLSSLRIRNPLPVHRIQTMHFQNRPTAPENRAKQFIEEESLQRVE